MEKLFTISIFTENHVGLLNRITIIFTRRHINIESITASESELKNIHRFTIVVRTTLDQAKKVIGQIEKAVEVFKAFLHEDTELVHQELALYKIRLPSITNAEVEKVIRENNARILSVDPEFIVIEKTGHLHETQALFEKLKPYGILEFARSGRVVITKPMKELSEYLAEMGIES